MTLEQHQIERMRAWVAFVGMWKPDVPENSMDFADRLLEHFDARFPAPRAEAPKEPDWIPHTPGDPMPVSRGTMVDVKLRGGATLYGVLMKPDAWYSDRASNSEIIAWRPAQ